MNRLLVVLVIMVFFCFGCQTRSNAKNNEMTDNKHKEKAKIGYVLHINSLSPFELYFDDILVKYEYRRESISTSVELNPYILENGKYKVKIRFLPPIDSKDGLLSPKDILTDNPDTRWKAFFMRIDMDPNDALGYSNELDYDNSELKMIPPVERVPYWEQEWEVEVKDLPYIVKGWKDSEDLSKWDRDVLEREVLAYYNELRDLLQKGKIKEYLELYKQFDNEIDVSTYVIPEQSKLEYENNFSNLSKMSPGNMLPIDNYEMRLYGQGRLVTLRIPEGKYKSRGVLFSEMPDKTRTSWGVLLHRPKGSNKFEIIRK